MRGMTTQFPPASLQTKEVRDVHCSRVAYAPGHTLKTVRVGGNDD